MVNNIKKRFGHLVLQFFSISLLFLFSACGQKPKEEIINLQDDLTEYEYTARWVEIADTEGIAIQEYDAYVEGELFYEKDIADTNQEEMADNRAILENSPQNGFTYLLIPGHDRIYYRSLEGLYEADKKTGECKQVIKWMDLDINGHMIHKLLAKAGGDLVVHYWSEDGQYLIFITKELKNEVQKKTTLTIGCFYASKELENEVAKFNRSQDAYHITIRDYAEKVDWSQSNASEEFARAKEQFTLDLLNDNAPDMFMNMYTGGLLENLVEKKAVEDLTPYLEKSTVLAKEDFFPSILQANTYQDVLYALPRSFSVQTCIGNADDWEENEKWTISDLKKLSGQYPDAYIFPNADRAEVFRLFTANSLDSFINTDTGKYDFEGQAFQDFLAICKNCPKEVRGENREVEKSLIGHQALLYPTDLFDLNSYIRAKEMFGCEVSCIGYPGNGLNSGPRVFSEGISISAFSEHKDICFSFIEKLMEDDSIMNHSITFGFPAKISAYEKKLDREWEDLEYMEEEKIVLYRNELTQMIEEIEDVPAADIEILSIISEEAAAYFEGQKDLETVTGLIQKRVNIYVSEKQ